MGNVIAYETLEVESVLADLMDSNHCREILELLPVAIYVTDAQGHLTHFNKAAVAMAGRTPELGTDKWCINWKLFHDDGRPMRHDECPMAMTLKEGRPVRGGQAIAERPDGKRFWFEPYPTPLFDSNGNLTGGINMLLDITERKHAERKLASEAESLSKLNELSSRLWRAPTLRAGLEEMLAATIELLGADFGNVQMLDPSCGVLSIEAQRGFEQPFLDFFREVSVEDDSACGRALRSGEQLVIEDVESDALFAPLREVARAAGFRAVQSTPLIGHAGAPLGMLSTHWRHPHRPDHQALNRLTLYMRQAVDFIERKRVEESLQFRERMMTCQREALELSIQNAPLETSLAVLVRAVIEGIGHDVRAGFYLANGEKTAIFHVVGMGAEYGKAVDGFTVGPDSLACGLATHTGKPILTSDVREDPLWQPWLWMAEKFDYRACWSFPILSGKDCFVGTLAVYSRQPREATPWDIDICRLISHTASLIIFRRQEADARKQMEQALRDSEERHRQTLDLMPAAVYSCDAAGVITYFNQQAANLWGRLPKTGDRDERFCGSEQLILSDGTILPHDKCPMAIALTEGRSFRDAEVCIQRPDGSRVQVLVNIDPVRNEQGQVIGAINAFHDISALKRVEQDLRESQERFRMVADNIAPLAWTCHTLGNVTWYNQRWLEYTGLSFEEMKGWDWSKVHHPDHLDRVVATMKHSAETGEPWEDTFPLRGADGSYRWFLSRAVPIRDDHGKIVRWFGTNTDITEQRAAEEALRDADRRKDEFLATLAHELRNPLAPLRNSLYILRLAKSDEGTAEQIHEMMEGQVNHMVRLVDDLMEVSRITRGKIELRKEPIDIAAVVRTAVETSRPLIEAAQHQLTISLPHEPVILEADPIRLAQIVTNLLNNAAKYTEEGGQIWLTVRLDASGAVISVRDTGMGIPADMLTKVFDLFTQVDGTYHRAQGGLGIGLTLVQSLVTMHGGSIEVRSDGPGRGSEFVVQLPVVAETPSSNGNERNGPSLRMSARRILVVDDNRDAADSLKMLFKLLGADVCTANDGPGALEALQTYRPSVALIDIGMPGMDGYEVARQARRQFSSGDVTLIALTGWGQEEDRRRSKEAGFDHHLVKPVDPSALQVLLESLPNDTPFRKG